MKGAKTVDEYLTSVDQWGAEMTRVCEILRSTGLEESVKWGRPSYACDGKLVAGVAGFKDYFALWFHQGALLSDPDGVLVNAQEGRTKALRQWRMTSAKAIKVRAIKAYVKEAVEHVRAGKAITPDRAKALVLPPELVDALALKKNAKAKAAFDALPKGKQREYADHIAEAKKPETKARRLEKALPMIAAGKGLHDKYRNC